MLYFFERAGSVIRCEIRVDWNGSGYELVVHEPNADRVEHFDESTALYARWLELEGRLISEGWSEPSHPRR
jgi:hypothetical protein